MILIKIEEEAHPEHESPKTDNDGNLNNNKFAILDKNFAFGNDFSPNLQKQITFDDVSSSDLFDMDFDFSDQKPINTQKDSPIQAEKSISGEKLANDDPEHRELDDIRISSSANVLVEDELKSPHGDGSSDEMESVMSRVQEDENNRMNLEKDNADFEIEIGETLSQSDPKIEVPAYSDFEPSHIMNEANEATIPQDIQEEPEEPEEPIEPPLEEEKEEQEECTLVGHPNSEVEESKEVVDGSEPLDKANEENINERIKIVIEELKAYQRENNRDEAKSATEEPDKPISSQINEEPVAVTFRDNKQPVMNQLEQSYNLEEMISKLQQKIDSENNDTGRRESKDVIGTENLSLREDIAQPEDPEQKRMDIEDAHESKVQLINSCIAILGLAYTLNL